MVYFEKNAGEERALLLALTKGYDLVELFTVSKLIN